MKTFVIGLIIFTFNFCIAQQKDSVTSATNKQEVSVTENFNEVLDVSFSTQVVTINCSKEPKISKFFLDSPPRVVVDIKDSILKYNKEEVVVDNKFIKKIRLRQFKSQPDKVVRVVLDLSKKYSFNLTTADKNINIEILVPKMEVVKKVNPGDISSSTQSKQIQEPEQKIEEPLQTSTSEKKQQITSAGNTAERKENEEKKITLPKTLVTLECVDTDITDVLQMLAVKSGINIVYGPDVEGKITISLKNVPFDKAFENILRISKLVYISVGENIVRVGTPQTIEQERTLQVVYTKIFPLNYAVADEVKAHLDQIRLAEGRTKGMITVDKRTNSLIVTESEEGLKYIEEWIKKLDTKPYQVSIEAQVIDISVDDLSDLGVQWGLRNVQSQQGSGVNYSLEQVGGAGVTVGQTNATARSVESMMAVAPTGVPIESAIFLFGRFTDALAVSGRLAMLVTQGKAKVLSNPRVTTVNNKTAIIIAGEKIPYKSATTVTTTGGGSGVGQTVQESWEYINAGIQLTVTPIVSPDGWVTLNVKPQVDIPQISGPGIPPTVKSRQTEVTVMVKNNEPLIIGGLISDSDIDAIKKVPLLGDLPILGYLFKYKSTTKKRTELIILITPRVIEG
ncbi:MAG: AMIN domain-containing protein [Endomicrobia bacterium]|nr:AMIN domain-containing protein [Endomicrobiia bacterium]